MGHCCFALNLFLGRTRRKLSYLLFLAASSRVLSCFFSRSIGFYYLSGESLCGTIVSTSNNLNKVCGAGMEEAIEAGIGVHDDIEVLYEAGHLQGMSFGHSSWCKSGYLPKSQVEGFLNS